MKVYVLIFCNDKNEVIKLHFIDFDELLRYARMCEDKLDYGFIKIKIQEDFI